MQRPIAHISGIIPWIGANFWSRSGGPLMWQHYDPDLVREELSVLHRHGLNMTRSFFYWPDFQPEPDVIDDELCGHFHDFLDAHHDLGMTTIPTFIVGHMSGENWDPVWRNGRNIYNDIWMVGRQSFYITELTRRFHQHPAISGWLISNEIPIYGGEGLSGEIEAWARLMVSAVRAGGGMQQVSVGDGAWGIETTGHDSGFSVREIAQLCDFVGPHVYRMATDVVRQHLNAAFACELAAVGNKPVVLEEFGASSDFVSEENLRHYYRQTLVNTLLAGASGWIAWNNTDYDNLSTQRPYSHHPFEQHFGITDVNGTPKGALLELQDFSHLIDRLNLPSLNRIDASTALVVSSYLDANYPFHDEYQALSIAANAQQGWVAAREAGLPTAVIREAEDGGLSSDARLYLIPSTKELAAPTWRQLVDLANSGRVIYVSYCAGESDFQRGPWWSHTAELFGVRNNLVYGMNDAIDEDQVTFTFTQDFGDLKAGESLTFRVAGNANSRAFLPVTVQDADIVALDHAGRPAIVRKQHGTGAAVLCTYPIEHFAAQNRGVNPEDTWKLYRALAHIAHATPRVRVQDPRILVDALIDDTGQEFWFLVSEHDHPIDVSVETDIPLTTLDGSAVNDPVHIEAWGYTVLTCTKE